jgi:mannitol-1-/sugar-/sorbitol-6-/2-deoxyglucose-6-phosphatase
MLNLQLIYLWKMAIKAVIFDMDGVIIDSEPFWRDAYKTVFPKYKLPVSDAMCTEAKGVKVDVVVKNWHKRYHLQTDNLDLVEKEIIEEVLRLIRTKGKAMPGLAELIECLKSRNIKTGLATSSLFSIMEFVLKSLHMEGFFDICHSAEAEKAGKPAPDVYLGAAKRLGVRPDQCIAIEDSVTGILSAKSAGMFALALPEAPEFEMEKYNIADLKIKSLLDVLLLDFDKLPGF